MVSANGGNGCLSPDRRQLVPKVVSLPLSADSPEIINELQRYTSASVSDTTEVATVQPERAVEGNVTDLPSAKLVQTSCGSMSHHDASVTNVVQPTMDTTAAQDLRLGTKRKAPSPPLDERASKQPSAKHSSAPLPSHGYPFAGGYGIPPIGLNSAMLGGSLGHPLFMGSASHYFQPPHTQLGDPRYMYPDVFGMNGTNNAPTSSCSSSLTTSTTAAVSTSSSPCHSIKATSSLPGTLPPFMLNPSMAGMLPPGYPLPYSPSLASLYSGSMLPGGLPGPAAIPGPAGASFLSQYPPAAASNSSSSPSPSSFSPSARSVDHRAPVVVNGGDVGRVSSSDDDDVIEVRGQ